MNSIEMMIAERAKLQASYIHKLKGRDMPNFVRYNNDEWSALYQDGKLVVIGDSYLSDYYLANYLKVEDIDSDDFLMGGSTRDQAAKTLQEIEDYKINLLQEELNALRRSKDQDIAELEAELSELKKTI